jgi:hypothetical protein
MQSPTRSHLSTLPPSQLQPPLHLSLQALKRLAGPYLPPLVMTTKQVPTFRRFSTEIKRLAIFPGIQVAGSALISETTSQFRLTESDTSPIWIGAMWSIS